jgi:hypothetical protein
MSEFIGMNITIGGELPADLVQELFKKIEDELCDIGGPMTKSELRAEVRKNKPVKWGARSNYGECESLKSFCRKHKLGYVHICDSNDQYDPELHYWVPGMKSEVIQTTTKTGQVVALVDQVRPLINLLLEYAKQGDKVLPLFVSNQDEDVKDVIEKSLKNPKKFFPAIEKKIKEFLPTIPILPPLTIKE